MKVSVSVCVWLNLQTIGGNIMSADPKYDLSSVLAAAECTLHIISTGTGYSEFSQRYHPHGALSIFLKMMFKKLL